MESRISKGGELQWQTRIVLTAGADAESNKVKAYSEARIHTAVIIALMLGRLLRTNASAGIQAVSEPPHERMAVFSRHPCSI